MTPGQTPIERFLRIAKLPAFPAVAIRIMELTSQENVDFSTVSRLLMTEASLSAEVLRAANSPLFGTRAEVKSIPQALATLGLNRVGMLVVTTALWRSVPGSINRQLVRAWWRHNLATAFLAKHLEARGRAAEDTAYLAGLMHSVGQLAMLGTYPVEYFDVLTRAANEGLAASGCEREAFGLDHCELGARLLCNWHMPEEFVEAARFHHEPEKSAYASTRRVSAACETANQLGYPVVSAVRSAGAAVVLAAGELLADEALCTAIAAQVSAIETSLL